MRSGLSPPLPSPRSRSVSFSCPRCTYYPRCTSCSPMCARGSLSTSPCGNDDSGCPDCVEVPKRRIRSGRVTRDRFSSLCYPCNMPTSRPYSSFQLECSQSSRRTPRRCYDSCPKSCSPSCALGVTRKQSCRRGCEQCYCSDCRSSCRASSKRGCKSIAPCGDTCSPEPSNEFVDAANKVGVCQYRNTPHMCPWEADVAVSGTVRAHCSSTADEVSNRLSGRFKANGKRFTTDSIVSRISCPGVCPQRLTIGVSDNGPRLNLSRNSAQCSDDLDLTERVNRIINQTTHVGRSHLESGNRSSEKTESNRSSTDGTRWANRRAVCVSKDYEDNLTTSNAKHLLDDSIERVNTGRHCNVSSSHRRSTSDISPSRNTVRHLKKGCLRHGDRSTLNLEADHAMNNNYDQQDGCHQRRATFALKGLSHGKNKDPHSFHSSRSFSPQASTSSSSTTQSGDVINSNLDLIHFHSSQKSSPKRKCSYSYKIDRSECGSDR